MKAISFFLTTPQFLDGSKTETRRLGWKTTKPGDRLRAVRKSQGVKKGDKVEVLGTIEVTGVRQERLHEITPEAVVREGFPNLTPQKFILHFCEKMKCDPYSYVTVIEFKKITG
jgi:hypothetical protein